MWEPEAWWETDLGSFYEIEEIRIWSRSDCCLASLNNTFVFVSQAPFLSKSVNTTLADPSVSGYFVANAEEVIVIPIQQVGRYIRLQHLGEGALNIAEVEIIAATGQIVNVDNEEEPYAPERLQLEALYPAPANGEVSVSYHIPVPSHVNIEVFDVLGRLRMTWLDTHQSAGTHRSMYDISRLPAGSYLVRLRAGRDYVLRSFIVAR